MRVTLLGHAGLAGHARRRRPSRYGGNTSCVEVVTGAGDLHRARRRHRHPPPRRLAIRDARRRVDILLTHLHMDHIQGLGFFAAV